MSGLFSFVGVEGLGKGLTMLAQIVENIAQNPGVRDAGGLQKILAGIFG